MEKDYGFTLKCLLIAEILYRLVSAIGRKLPLGD